MTVPSPRTTTWAAFLRCPTECVQRITVDPSVSRSPPDAKTWANTCSSVAGSSPLKISSKIASCGRAYKARARETRCL